MGTKLAIALISKVGEVWKAPRIYSTVLLCISLGFLSGYVSGTLL